MVDWDSLRAALVLKRHLMPSCGGRELARSVFSLPGSLERVARLTHPPHIPRHEADRPQRWS
jgi:hypothetical protein